MLTTSPHQLPTQSANRTQESWLLSLTCSNHYTSFLFQSLVQNPGVRALRTHTRALDRHPFPALETDPRSPDTLRDLDRAETVPT